MILYIKRESGSTFIIEAQSADTIKKVKDYIQDKVGIPLDQQRLIRTGKLLEDNKSLTDYGIKNNSTIHLGLRIRGC